MHVIGKLGNNVLRIHYERWMKSLKVGKGNWSEKNPMSKIQLALHIRRFYIHGFYQWWIKNIRGGGEKVMLLLTCVMWWGLQWLCLYQTCTELFCSCHYSLNKTVKIYLLDIICNLLHYMKIQFSATLRKGLEHGRFYYPKRVLEPISLR